MCVSQSCCRLQSSHVRLQRNHVPYTGQSYSWAAYRAYLSFSHASLQVSCAHTFLRQLISGAAYLRLHIAAAAAQFCFFGRQRADALLQPFTCKERLVGNPIVAACERSGA